MSDDRRVVKMKKDVKLNAATIVIAAILLYVIIRIFIAVRKKPITTYRVSNSNITNNIELEGLAVRDEAVVRATTSGYVCYYIREGEKIKRYSTVCTIDSTGTVKDMLTDTEKYENLLTPNDYKEIRDSISSFKLGYSDTNFHNAYNFKSTVNSKVYTLTSGIIMQQMEANGQGNYLTQITAPYSGILAYYTDGFEDYDIANIKASDFDKTTYQQMVLNTGSAVESRTEIAKILTSEDWKIVAPITDEQINQLAEKSRIRFTINRSNYVITMPFEIIDGTDGKYIQINLNKYLSNFINERYLSVKILLDDNVGLKIPVSSLVEKEVYKIPISFFSAGGNQSYTNRVNVQIEDENGEVTIKQIAPAIYMQDENFCYVDPLLFNESDILLNIETNVTMQVSMLQSDVITGVYNANRGIAEFRMVKVTKVIDDFALIQDNGGVKAFDNIILNSNSVKENQIIY